jgi:hypothetical protein
MFERMLDKEYLPNICEIEKYIGIKATKYVHGVISSLKNCFNVKIEVKFPFGKNYGWGYKLSISSKHICYIFFERKAITITIQLENIDSEFCKSKYEELSDVGKEYWKNRYPCGDGGGWIHYRILDNDDYIDIGKFIMMKVNKEFEWILAR